MVLNTIKSRMTYVTSLILFATGFLMDRVHLLKPYNLTQLR